MSGLALVFEAVALAADLDDVAVMQQPVEQCGGQRAVVGQGRGPLGKGQIAGQHDGATLIAPGHDLEEKMGIRNGA